MHNNDAFRSVALHNSPMVQTQCVPLWHQFAQNEIERVFLFTLHILCAAFVRAYNEIYFILIQYCSCAELEIVFN